MNMLLRNAFCKRGIVGKDTLASSKYFNLKFTFKLFLKLYTLKISFRNLKNTNT